MQNICSSVYTLPSEGFFPGEGQQWIFPKAKNIFPEGQSGVISFRPLETLKTTFFAKNFTAKCQILKSMGYLSVYGRPCVYTVSACNNAENNEFTNT